ncbi:MAG: pilus assembly protein [Chloroflexi bacterium]|nr:pilus assembly protein [Chloroflexota bacterium]
MPTQPVRWWMSQPVPPDGRGQAIVEFALIGWVLVIVIMAVFDFGYAFYSYEAITNGAREGARYAIGDPTNVVSITTAAKNQLVLLDPNQVNVSVTNNGSTAFGRPITVALTYTYTPLSPLLTAMLGNGYQMTAKSSMAIE